MDGKFSPERTESIFCDLRIDLHSLTLVEKYHDVLYIADYIEWL